MDDIYKIFFNTLPGLIIGIIVGIVSSMVSNHFALKRYYSEKWWEKKADAYSKVMESLYHMLSYTEDLMKDPRNKDIESDKLTEKFLSRSIAASEEINKITSAGTFLISQEATNRLLELKKDFEKADQAENFYEYLDLDSSAIESCIQDIRRFAKTDLKVS